eukprot:gene20070-20607_t
MERQGVSRLTEEFAGFAEDGGDVGLPSAESHDIVSRRVQMCRAASIMSQTLALWIAIAIVALIAIGQIFSLRRLARQRREAVAWPKVEGVVVASSVTGTASIDTTDSGSFEPVVRYQYMVAGNALEGSRIAIASSGAMTERADAEDIADSYPVGQRVDVRYDPAHPDKAVLEIATARSAAFHIVLGVVAAAVLATLLSIVANGGHAPTMASGLPYFALLLPAAVFVFAIACLGSVIPNWRRAQAQAGWPSTTGTVTEAEIVSIIKRLEDKTTETHYRVRVRYGYSVGGRDYTGTRVWTGTRRLEISRDAAEKALAGMTIGASVPVYYDPDAPRSSVLVRDGGSFPVGLLICGLVLGAVGLLVLWAMTTLTWQ